ncbi:hypothetical protein SAMN05444920_12669 [Nonomuraea solani]|uniref:ParB-like nuclease domain-containing protein n=1 Tax=Nonomuraea solani TaxID=1144553 RepID=A0A1H6EZ85_9ACTN|nr:hypothetical protein [Nonomuraea solani]SEH02411.1 hypothetical protein SAMN05444920_12669 [Nonomuraea solani]
MTRRRTVTGEPRFPFPASPLLDGPEPGRTDSSRVEFFQMLGWRWDITEAKRITQGRAPDGWIVPERWAAMIQLIAIDAEHAYRVDLSEPLIMARVPNGGMLIIDGWHRLCKAVALGVAELSAVILTEEEELACRIFDGQEDDDKEETEEEGDMPDEDMFGSA